MSAEVLYIGSEFTITITNGTTVESYTKGHPPGSAKRTSAEWIAGMNEYELSDFGTVGFGRDYTSVGPQLRGRLQDVGPDQRFRRPRVEVHYGWRRSARGYAVDTVVGR